MNSNTKEHFEHGKKKYFRYDRKGAEEAFREALSLEPNDPTVSGWLAITLAQLEKYDDALELINQFEKWDISEFCIAKGFISKGRDGDKQEAIAQYNKAIAIDPNNELAYTLRGYMFMMTKKKELVYSDLKVATQISKNPYVYYMFGLFLSSLDDHVGALENYTIAVELDPNYVWALNERGYLKFYILEDYQGALTDYNKVIELDPEHNLAWANRGYLKAKLDDTQGAINDLTRALEIGIDIPWVLNKRAEIYKSLGNYELCLSDRSRYYSIEGPRQPTYTNPKPQNIAECVYSHFTNKIYPQLTNNGEKLIDYWECALYWGEEIFKSRTQKNQLVTTTSGNYGVGYIVLSDKFLRILSLGNLSETYNKKPQLGFGTRLVLAALGDFDFRNVERSDQQWTIPFKDMNGLSKSNEGIHLTTTSEIWQVESYFSDDEYMHAAIEYARTGNLRKLIDVEKLVMTPKQSNSDDEIFEKIEKLASLKEKGIITHEEFEQKKKELLARI